MLITALTCNRVVCILDILFRQSATTMAAKDYFVIAIQKIYRPLYDGLFYSP